MMLRGQFSLNAVFVAMTAAAVLAAVLHVFFNASRAAQAMVVFWFAALIFFLLPWLLARCYGWMGAACSVVLIWLAVHTANLITLRLAPDQIDAPFTGLWFCLGWVLCIVYALAVYGVIALLRALWPRPSRR
jgi:hypothetical protein